MKSLFGDGCIEKGTVAFQKHRSVKSLLSANNSLRTVPVQIQNTVARATAAFFFIMLKRVWPGAQHFLIAAQVEHAAVMSPRMF